MTMHDDQLPITLSMVQELVAAQFPRWSHLPIEPVRSEGTVNAIFRIGDGLAARFCLRPQGQEVVRQWLQAEAVASRELLAHTTFPIPVPVTIGEPGAGYPMPWAVQTWLPGTTASVADPSTSVAYAEDLAEFIHQVRSIDVAGRAFGGSGRGGDLQTHDRWVETCLRRSETYVDTQRLRALWQRWRSLPREAPDVMTHGDLVPGNVLVADGRLTGVVDVGGLGPADPALDLVAAWHLLDEEPRKRLRRKLGCGDLEWERGKAWALEQALGAVWYYVGSNPAMSRMGRRTIERILVAEYGSDASS
jgi:aminoglycoside phosphotransferase (APT) family kinase protein